MYKSILQFGKKGIVNIENIGADFFEHPKDIHGLVTGIRAEVLTLGAGLIGDFLEEMDRMIRDSAGRKKHWEIVRRDRKTLLTSIGEVTFLKTMYKNKKTGERRYLLDDMIGIEKNARMTEDAEAALLEEVVETSYRRAGEAVSLTDHVSKGTVKNKLHQLQFPSEVRQPAEKKKVRYLYIDADEDHVPLQFLVQKGDIESFPGRRKNNTVLSKLVYVYEGIEPEAPQSKRFRLIYPHYFSGVYEGEANRELWDNVYTYIEATYDLDAVEKIYLNADGGSWIKSGKTRIAGLITVLDEYHMNKYLVRMTSHLEDSAEDGRDLLRRTIRRGTKTDFQDVVKRMQGHAKDEHKKKHIQESAQYILSNWTAAKVRLNRGNGVIGSSTEGHVSHVLASRMSSRPMGWSKKGVDKMSKLRAYWWNGNRMLELVRVQKEPLEKVAGMEEVFSSMEMRTWEREHYIADGKYFDRLQCSPGAQVRKILAIRERINI